MRASSPRPGGSASRQTIIPCPGRPTRPPSSASRRRSPKSAGRSSCSRSIMKGRTYWAACTASAIPAPFSAPIRSVTRTSRSFWPSSRKRRNNPASLPKVWYGLAPVILDSANAAQLSFARRYRARFGQEPRWEAVAGYEAATLALDAIRTAVAEAPGDPAAQRARVTRYLLELTNGRDAPQGLLGRFPLRCRAGAHDEYPHRPLHRKPLPDRRPCRSST